MNNDSGVMPGRTWVIAADAESLCRRWQTLIAAKSDKKEELFHPHLRKGLPGDKHSKRIVPKAIPGYQPRPMSVADDRGDCPPPVRYGFRSFDRQWIIPDSRLINRTNPELWRIRSKDQVYLTAPTDRSPSLGPALSFTALIPDLHHYNGRGGRVFPLWRDREAGQPNVRSGVLSALSRKYRTSVSAEDVIAYIAAIAAHPAYTARFAAELARPGLRIPLTSNGNKFAAVAEIGRTVIWLHTFGERFTDPTRGRPMGPPRLPPEKKPLIPKNGAIPHDPVEMPDAIDYDSTKRRLIVGGGFVEGVTPEMWNYEVSGKHVLRQWFSSRKKNRERPIIGDRRHPSKLGEIQPDHWLAEYTAELINVLNVIGLLIDLEPLQADMLERVCSGQTLAAELVSSAVPGEVRSGSSRKTKPTDSQGQMRMFD